jgi:hypothetical protein
VNLRTSSIDRRVLRPEVAVNQVAVLFQLANVVGLRAHVLPRLDDQLHQLDGRVAAAVDALLGAA